MAYSIHDLELAGLQIKTILSVHIFHKPGEHGVLEILADMGEENGDFPIQEAGSRHKITLYEKRNGTRRTLFCGVIVNLEVKSSGKSYHALIKAYTNSYLMDIKKKSRSFQDTSMTIGALFSHILKEYKGKYQVLISDRAIGEIAVQYRETDWQFLKRVLSQWNIPLVSSEVREEICLYCGVAHIPNNMEIISVERIWKDIEALDYWKEAGKGLKNNAFIFYKLKLDNYMELYSEVEYQNENFSVAEIEYKNIGNVLYEFVTLQNASGILQKSIYPMELVGSALEGNILNVKGEKVQIHLKIDDGCQGNDCYWFPFSTPSASQDGSGWYCMPEKGDQVRVYFPSKRTGDVVAVSAVSTYNPIPSMQKSTGGSGTEAKTGTHSGSSGSYTGSGGGNNAVSSSSAGETVIVFSQEGAGEALPMANGKVPDIKKTAGKDRMSDPITKYLRTSSGQEINLSYRGIEINCKDGTVKIEILKSGRINLYASDSIQISFETEIKFKAKSVMSFMCGKMANLSSEKGGSLFLNEEGKLIIQGTEVFLN